MGQSETRIHVRRTVAFPLTVMSYVILLALFTTVAFPQHTILHRYRVGFSVSVTFDTSRQLPGTASHRPIQMGIWYPAEPSDKTPMEYRDYFLLSGSELTTNALSEEEGKSLCREYSGMLVSNGIDPKDVEKLFSLRMESVRNAATRQGKYPLVIVAQGNYQSLHHQSMLCEAIASCGYVVVSSPSQTRISGPMKSDTEAPASMTEQLQDVEYLYTKAMELPFIDRSGIAIVGHSFGGRTAALFASLHPETKAVISLDGGIALRFAVKTIALHQKFKRNGFNAPVLHFYQTREELLTPDFSFLDGLQRVRKEYIPLPHFRHFNFTTFGAAVGSIPGLVTGSAPEIAGEWDMLVEKTIGFLQENLPAVN